MSNDPREKEYETDEYAEHIGALNVKRRELEPAPFEEVRYYKIKNTVSPLWMNKDNLQICIDNTCTNGGAEVVADVTHRNNGFLGKVHMDSFFLGCWMVLGLFGIGMLIKGGF